MSTSAMLVSEDPSEPQALVCPQPVHYVLIVYIQLHRCPGYKRREKSKSVYWLIFLGMWMPTESGALLAQLVRKPQQPFAISLS